MEKDKEDKEDETKRDSFLGDVVEHTPEIYSSLKFWHPPSAFAMVLGALGLGYLGWWLFRDTSPIIAMMLWALGAFLGAWIGLLLYWLLRITWGIIRVISHFSE